MSGKACLILSVAIVLAQPCILRGEAVYVSDFEGEVGGEWSDQKTDVTPVGARRFLGQFGNKTVTLTLSNLPSHGEVHLSFDLFIIRSWDGDAVPVPEGVRQGVGPGHLVSGGQGGPAAHVYDVRQSEPVARRVILSAILSRRVSQCGISSADGGK